MMKLGLDFYRRNNVVEIARELIGKELYTFINQKLTSGVITETEAYVGVTDRASHAFGNRRTARTEVMYSAGGLAYVYLCYGIHSLFNIVTNAEDNPDAVLIRAIKPLKGIDVMLGRARKNYADNLFGIGPGKVSKIMGISCVHSGINLIGNTIWLEDEKNKIDRNRIECGTRIGIEYAGDDAKLPYRFTIRDL